MIARAWAGAFFGALLLLARPGQCVEPEDEAWLRCSAYPDSCGPPHADPPPSVPMRAHSGLQLGVRVSYAAPEGGLAGPYVQSAPAMSDVFGPWYALGVDVGYRFTPVLYLGVTSAWGPTGAGMAPTHGGSVVNLLFDARFYLAPESRSGAWLAYDAGWEIATVDAGAGHATYQGPVVANLQLGYDIRGGAVAVAPYVGVTFSEFVTHALDPEPPGFVAAIDARAYHEWLTVGLRGSYGPW